MASISFGEFVISESVNARAYHICMSYIVLFNGLELETLTTNLVLDKIYE